MAGKKTDTQAATTMVTTPGTPVIAPVVKNPVFTKSAIDIVKLNKLKAIRLKQVDFDTFSGKAQAKLNLDGKNNDVTMNIRIKKNKEIWVSITAILGIEVARAIITPDSIKVLNRLDATYLKKPFSYVYDYTSRQINYQTLESLVIGNAVPQLVADDASLMPDNAGVIIIGNIQELAYKLILGSDFRVTQTSMSNPAAGQSVQVNNSSFIQADNRIIPSHININSTVRQKSINIDLHYTKADFDQNVEFPFSVPARFKLIN